MHLRLSPYLAAHERYDGYRDEARAAVRERAFRWLLGAGRDVQDLRLTDIDDAALAFWEWFWRPCHPGVHYDGDFPWDAIVDQIRTTPRRLELAIWADGTLCGLCAGMASKNASHVAIRFLERFHGDNPVRGFVMPIAVAYAEAYAIVLGRRELKIRNPTEGATPSYEELGFRLVTPRKCRHYLAREV